MATAIQMPALSPTMKEGKITRWLKKEGDTVSSGEAIAECETDKSNLEIESYDDGVLLRIAVREGESAPVGAPIAYVGEKGEKIEEAAPPPAPAPAPAAQPVPAAPPARPAPPPPRPQAPPARGAHRVRVSPIARKIAAERGMPLEQLSGSGPQGRVVKRDVEAALSRGAAAPALPPRGPAPAAGVRRAPERVPLSATRRVIAERLTEVKPGIPHFYLTMDVEMDAALGVREEAGAVGVKVSVNDLLVKAVAVALRRVPKVNVQFQGDHLAQLYSVDVGIAVALEEGLVTPIVRDADQKGLAAIAEETRDLAERARRRALKPEEYHGGSITLSNLGMYGIDSFVAVINPPQAAIVAVGAVAERAVVRDGRLAVRKMMSATLSGDHRAIDGAVGAEYLRELKGLLEHPTRLLL